MINDNSISATVADFAEHSCATIILFIVLLHSMQACCGSTDHQKQAFASLFSIEVARPNTVQLENGGICIMDLQTEQQHAESGEQNNGHLLSVKAGTVVGPCL